MLLFITSQHEREEKESSGILVEKAEEAGSARLRLCDQMSPGSRLILALG